MRPDAGRRLLRRAGHVDRGRLHRADGRGAPGPVRPGLATAPAPVASAVAGSYVITAQAQGAQSVEFMLTNEPQGAPAAFRLEAVDGLNQQAAVGAVYGKPLSVRVVDAQQRPRTGVVVTFALPGSGPSALSLDRKRVV